MKRFFCWLMGCVDNQYGYCDRCGAGLYCDEFGRPRFRDDPCVLVRLWNSLRSFLSRVRNRVLGVQCEVCHRRFRPKINSEATLCSDECYSKWIPF